VSSLAVPRRKPGRPSAADNGRYAAEVKAFCAALLEFRSGLEFAPSARGWCYTLEEDGLSKDDFDAGEKLINDCRKSGDLPLDICGEDDKRGFESLESLDLPDIESEAQSIVETVRWLPGQYTPISFWDDQPYYLQALVEKIDIRQLFSPICGVFKIPIANAGGWNNLSCRAELMRRFKHWEAKGKQCVLLYFGDHDPGGLQISRFLRSNLADLSRAVGWSPDNLIIDRFGLNSDFIEEHGLTWIDGLSTGNPRTPNLEDPRHPDHGKEYVRSYLKRFGARKVEANALLAPRAVEAGKELCREAFLKYVTEDAPERYRERLDPLRDQVRAEVLRILAEEFGSGDAP
jgi:hypothetical protein